MTRKTWLQRVQDQGRVGVRAARRSRELASLRLFVINNKHIFLARLHSHLLTFIECQNLYLHEHCY